MGHVVKYKGKQNFFAEFTGVTALPVYVKVSLKIDKRRYFRSNVRIILFMNIIYKVES